LDTLIKSQVLYQLSYGCILSFFAGAKLRTFFDSTKLFMDFLLKKCAAARRAACRSIAESTISSVA
ncbi:MAG: hypothetical protein J1E58_06745, partial [Prevotella sp.]|nr:hypothetical protein [Prevotella sp.]